MSAVSQPQAAPSPLEKSPSTAILCNTCGNVCKGEVLRVQNKYFHIKCFVCKACGCDLAEGGFFVRQGEYICTLDYQRLYGTRCFSCDQFIEGEVVSALGKTYHPDCFVCAVCRLPFPPGDRVTFNGKECMCQKCSLPMSVGSSTHLSQGLRSCGGCGTEIRNGQALVALDKHWHLGCFKCKSCGKLLNAEYISKDGLPYCEADYHAKFGIRCDSCEKYITGRVLEAGEKHYHPSCALCVRCGQMFAEGEEMYLQGSSIWHPACRQAARTEDRNKETRTSSESIISVPASSTSGSPSRVIYAKLGGEILDYRDLAALPKSKAIYDIDRPDMISYSPYISHSAGDRQSYGESPQLLSPTPTEGDQDDRSYKQCRTSSPSSTGSVSLGRYTPTSRSPQHYSRPAGTVSVGASSCLSLSQHPSPTSMFRHHYIPHFRGKAHSAVGGGCSLSVSPHGFSRARFMPCPFAVCVLCVWLHVSVCKCSWKENVGTLLHKGAEGREGLESFRKRGPGVPAHPPPTGFVLRAFTQVTTFDFMCQPGGEGALGLSVQEQKLLCGGPDSSTAPELLGPGQGSHPMWLQLSVLPGVEEPSTSLHGHPHAGPTGTRPCSCSPVC
uniref:Actin binding LIM protein family member 2 n=1 Tax=Callithrix jacchus TaxID=9483 RepID=A0A8I3WDT1_CALJA